MKLNSFSQFLVEEDKTAYFTFGRMNPPTIGHEKLLTSLSKKAKGNPYFVYLSQSADPKKNPLKFTDKVKFARKSFPKHARQILVDKKVKNVFDVAVKLANDGYKNIVMVVGSDRVREFDVLLNKYNGKKGRHGLYNFNSISVMSAGDRDPDAEGAEGMSASKMRAAATSGDFATFGQGVSKSLSNAEAKKLYNAVRSGMGLKEQREFKNHVQLEPVSETREAYISGVFQPGDEVVILENDIVATVVHRGANYLIVESDGVKMRKWLDAVKLLEKEEKDKEAKKSSPQDPDIKDKDGTQPKAYFKGLKPSTKDKRDTHFKKNAKKADDDPSAYKPAPGDATAKTKPSKHTKKFKQMFGDD